MPIGWLLGLSIALIWSGYTLASANRKKYQGSEALALQRDRFRVVGITMLEIGIGTLIGTLIELYVR